MSPLLIKKYFVNEEGIVEERNPYYKHFYSHYFVRKGYNWKIIYLEVVLFIRIKIKRYLSKICRLNYQTEFPDLYEKYFTFSINLRND